MAAEPFEVRIVDKSRPTTSRHDATRREVRRGMLTWLDAILAHVAELEERVASLEARLAADNETRLT